MKLFQISWMLGTVRVYLWPFLFLALSCAVLYGVDKWFYG